MLFNRLQNWTYLCEKKNGITLWQKEHLLSPDQVSYLIQDSIIRKKSFLVGKVGSNEQLLVLWASRTPIRSPFRVKRRVLFQETQQCATNAGVKPRSPESYLELFQYFRQTLILTDILGIFKLEREKQIHQQFAPQASICTQSHFTPFFSDIPWTRSLAQKRVFVVSPFLNLFKQQMEKRTQIWPDSEILPEFSLDGYQFPYLIDENSTLDWREVYQDVLEQMISTEFDVALFGCGALGFPLAAEAKKLGKVGIHLGGMLQVLFGVIGKRYEEHDYFKQQMNQAWIRPPTTNRPSNFQAVEGGCYW